jgi:hypothetical protein
MYFDSVKVAYTIYHTSIIRVAFYKYLRKTEIYKDCSYTKEDLQYNQYNHDPFKSLSVGRIDTLLEKFEHILENLPSQSRPRAQFRGSSDDGMREWTYIDSSVEEVNTL